jgi:hypothetical protein
MQSIRVFFVLALTSLAFNSYAGEVEVSSYLGYTFSPDLVTQNKSSDVSVDNNLNFSLGFAWQENSHKLSKKKGQGQLLINYISRDFTAGDIDNNLQTDKKFSLDTLYVHFNGVSFMQESSYNTTVSLGFGATYFNTDFDNAIYPSVSTAIGTRHEITPELTFITEVRIYATLVDDDDPLFCQQNSCVSAFEDALWFDTNISIGLAYSF